METGAGPADRPVSRARRGARRARAQVALSGGPPVAAVVDPMPVPEKKCKFAAQRAVPWGSNPAKRT
ncbi:hypothetical protein Ato02nite_026360 [Paractinoplanes toevensis]|uniref:Uncharacterized protein n=1 Tax=Paractinoplanes toevensis TaxID=571911 RepID=A0A919W540_9ACTN|nr:hypothetical protein Ato02nite_026360 [Actinoplanes toevensis]